MTPRSTAFWTLLAFTALTLPARADPKLFPHVQVLESAGNIISDASPGRDAEFYKIGLNGEIKVEHMGRAVYTANAPGTVIKFGGKWLMQGGIKIGDGRVKVEGAFGMFAYRCACLDGVIITLDEGEFKVEDRKRDKITVVAGEVFLDCPPQMVNGWGGPTRGFVLHAGQSITWGPREPPVITDGP